MAMKPNATTISDVAKLAETSQTTVSLVINHVPNRPSRVGEATYQRVLSAINTLGYVPNTHAQTLRRGRTHRLCLFANHLDAPYNVALARDLQAIAGERGYSVVAALGTLSQTLKHMRQHLADGIVIFDHNVTAADLKPLVDVGLPIVVLNNVVEPDGFDVMRTTRETAFHRAIDHLVDRGHRRIAFIGPLSGSVTHCQRFRTALGNHDIAVDPRLICDAPTPPEAFEITLDLLGRSNPPTAIVASSDRRGLVTLWAIQQLGLEAGKDVAVVGAGNIPDTAIYQPRLSTIGPVRLDFTGVARALFQRLDADADAPLAGRVITQPWEFIQRDST